MRKEGKLAKDVAAEEAAAAAAAALAAASEEANVPFSDIDSMIAYYRQLTEAKAKDGEA
jgi:hypothetical protein